MAVTIRGLACWKSGVKFTPLFYYRHSPQSNSRLLRIPVRRQQPAGFQIHPWNPGSVYFHCPNSPFFSLMEITPEQFHAAEHLGFPLKQCESDAANGSAYGIAPFLILIISVQICSLQSQNTAVFSAKQEKSQSPQSSKNYGFWLFILLIIYGQRGRNNAKWDQKG